MRKNKISKYIIFVSFFTLFSMFVYVVQKSYDNIMAPMNQVKTNTLLKPIDTKLDSNSIEFIEKRILYPEEEIAAPVIVSTTSATPGVPSLTPSPNP